MMERVLSSTITGTMDEKRVHESNVSQSYLRDVNAHKEFVSCLSYSSVQPHNDERDASLGSEDCDGIIRVPSGSGYRIMTPFPWRLHEMLEEIEEKRLSWIVSWTPDGKAFQVHSPEQFTSTIVPMYFRHKRYKSFQVSACLDERSQNEVACILNLIFAFSGSANYIFMVSGPCK